MSTNGDGGYGSYGYGEPRELPSFADMSSQQRSASMDATVRQVAALSAHHNAMSRRIALLVDEIAALKAVDEAHGAWHLRQTSSFLARLRWLLTGK